VKYKGKTVLFRAHVPILNVEYEQQAPGCGPHYRDWQYDEFWFQCSGTDVAPGFRLCPAKTILDTNTDGGNFRGVAVYVEGREVVLKSVLSAGWYRYVSEWRFGVDGTLKPRWGFARVLEGANCVCVAHHHHVYWRFDFDIETAGKNLVTEYNNPPLFDSNYHDKLFEIRRPKDYSRQRRWEISNTRTKRRYALIPGPQDGTSTAFGHRFRHRRRVGLQYHHTELDDGSPEPKAHLDEFLTGESVKDRCGYLVWCSFPTCPTPSRCQWRCRWRWPGHPHRRPRFAIDKLAWISIKSNIRTYGYSCLSFMIAGE
jgi:hypothetical protein